jgi:hypothetical protein
MIAVVIVGLVLVALNVWQIVLLRELSCKVAARLDDLHARVALVEFALRNGGGEMSKRKGNPKAASVPAEKAPGPLPTDGQHYACYWPAGGKSIFEGTALRDRWEFYCNAAARIVCVESGECLYERAA